MDFKRITMQDMDYQVRNDWYGECIEKPLIPTVKFLRENGINTTGSCAHDNYILWSSYWDNRKYVRRLLKHFGYDKFRIYDRSASFIPYLYKVFLHEKPRGAKK